MEAAELELLFPFQSTPLMRGETGSQADFKAKFDISIHSPHARGDLLSQVPRKAKGHFNPLPSCEGRRLLYLLRLHHGKFQSTPLMRGETSGRDATRVGST